MWSDPWTCVARTGRTLLSPPPPNMSDCTMILQTRDSLPSSWTDLVGTSLAPNIIHSRLESCLVPCLYRDSNLVATCVFRPHPTDIGVYAIETFVAQKGHKYGRLLLHSAIYEMYQRIGPHAYVFIWELTVFQLIGAYMKGWLTSMVSLEYGWMYLCLGNQKMDDRITYLESGIDDVVYCSPAPVTPYLKKRGKVWTISSICPGPGWSWTGEFIITGNLNASAPIQRWFTTEIASR